MTARTVQIVGHWLVAGAKFLARLLAGLVLLLVGLVLVSGGVGGAGFQLDATEDTCFRSPRLQPPPGSGVSSEARNRVEVGLHLFPLGLNCIYRGPQGQEIVVNDIKLWPTLALATGPPLMVFGVRLPFRRVRRPRGAPAPTAAPPA